MSELQDAHDAEWERVRYKRDQLLAGTDWVVSKAAEKGNKVPPEWVAYRQALRDLTDELNPFLLKWPVPPPTPAPKRRIYTPAN